MMLRRALVGTLLLSNATPLTVLAQGEELMLEEVIVTATRRTERLQDVAMSVSAFSGDFFIESGINNLTGLDQYTPNLQITPGPSSRDTSYRIRGIGSVGSNSGIDPSVGIFLDGIYQGRAGMSIGDLMDVERVEILRGPQGSLYGKNTAAGAISVVTKRPSPEAFESLLELSYDSDERGELRGMVNLPLGDSPHAMRLSGWYVNGDHLYENTLTGKGVNDANKWGGRARFLFDGDRGVNGDLGEFIVTLDYTREDNDCCAMATITFDGLSPLNTPATHNPSAAWQAMLGKNDNGDDILRYFPMEDSEGFSPPEADAFDDDYWFDGDLFNEVDVGGVAVEWNKELAGGSVLTFLNGWRFYELDSAFDGDFSAYDASQNTQKIDLDQYSSELRITSPGGENLEYQGGLYAYYSEFDSVGETEQGQALVDNLLLIPELDIFMDAFFPNGSVNTDTNTYTTTSYAAFGQAVWHFSEKLSATVGLRWTYEKKEREGSQKTDPPFEQFDVPPVAGPFYEYDHERSDSDISPSFNLRYFFTPDVMGYALLSRGFKSGGFDQRRQVKDETGEFDEEIATNYELGWKTSWANRRLQFNGSLFLVDYEDFQSQSFDGANIRVVNAGDLRSYGAELELVFIPMADMTIGTAIGYNKAEYESFDFGQCTIEQVFHEYYIVQGAQGGSPGTASVCTQDLADEPLDNAPEWTVSSFLSYDRRFGDDLLGTLRLEHSYTDEYYLDQDLDENLKNDSVNLVNLRLSLSNMDRDWEVTLWGRNMLDEEYYAWGIDTPTMGGYAGVTAPEAVYGVTLRWYN